MSSVTYSQSIGGRDEPMSLSSGRNKEKGCAPLVYAKRRKRKYIKSMVRFAITAVAHQAQSNYVRFIPKYKENITARTRDNKASRGDWRMLKTLIMDFLVFKPEFSRPSKSAA